MRVVYPGRRCLSDLLGFILFSFGGTVIRALIGALCVTGVVAPVSAQERTTLEGPATCDECSLSFERQAVIHDVDGEAGLSWQPVFITRAPNGHLFVVSSEFKPLHYDSSGEFIGSLGREGAGPGEHRSVSTIRVGPSDTLWVVDGALGRRSAWSIEGEFLTSYRAPGGGGLTDAVVFDDGSWVTSGIRREPEAIGFPFHRFDLEGERLASFGPEVTISPAERIRPPSMRRNIAAADGKSFWSSNLYAYELARYAMSGERLQAISRQVEWFAEQDTIVRVPTTRDLPPSPQIRWIVQDDEGLLRVAIRVPDEDWRSGIGERQEDPRFPGAGVLYTPMEYDQVYDTVIEIIDPENGVVLVSQRIDDLVFAWVDADHIATYREDEWDLPVIEIVKVDLVRP